MLWNKNAHYFYKAISFDFSKAIQPNNNDNSLVIIHIYVVKILTRLSN